ADRCDEAIGKLEVMQDRSAARRAPDKRARAAGFMGMAIGMRLEVAERQRRILPGIEAERWRSQLAGRDHQRFVDRHVPRTSTRRIDQQASVHAWRRTISMRRMRPKLCLGKLRLPLHDWLTRRLH